MSAEQTTEKAQPSGVGILTPDEENEVRTEHRRVCQCGGSLCGYEGRAVSVVERILAARLAPVWAILHAWEAWDGSRGPDGQMHPDSSSPRDRERLREALSGNPTPPGATS